MPELASTTTERDRFPSYISLSADSRDIVAYMDLPPEAREPVTTNRISVTKVFSDGHREPRCNRHF